jgi:hypothetical protein
MEGAGVHLRRAFGFGNTKDFDPFLLLDDFRTMFPMTISPDFPGTPIVALRRSPMCLPEPSSTATAWEIAAPSSPAMCSG